MKRIFYLGLFFCSTSVFSQIKDSVISKAKDIVESIHGNFQVDAQYYNKDTTIGAPIVPQKVLSNGFGNINYIRGNFSAGMRYESYNPVMQGFDQGIRVRAFLTVMLGIKQLIWILLPEIFTISLVAV